MLCCRCIKWCLRCGKHFLKTWSSEWFSNSTSGYIPKRTDSRNLNRYLYTRVHSSIIHNRQNMETTQMSTDGRINKLWCIQATLEYCSAFKRNEILTQATTWMNLEVIRLSEIIQTQKTTHYMIPFIWNIQNRQIHRDRKYSGSY